MHFRRATLLFALVLGLAAVAAAVSPSRQVAAPPVAPQPSRPSGEPATRQLTFAAGPKKVGRVREGQHVVVSVAWATGGVATIPRLGLTADIGPAAPAQFDLLAPSPGRYDVLVTPAGATGARTVGLLLSRP